MAYKWTTGETITAAKLNTTGMVLACGYTDDTQQGKMILDKTAQEIIDALRSGMVVTVVIDMLETDNTLVSYRCETVALSDSTYEFYFYTGMQDFGPFLATSLSEYPELAY